MLESPKRKFHQTEGPLEFPTSVMVPEMMKAAAKSILEDFHLLEPARRLRRRIRRPFKPSDRVIAARYLAQSSTPKLNIGCGIHLLTGWLNTDYSPELPPVMYLDARQRFPFKEETFDYIFSEHVIEHVSYSDGMKMLTGHPWGFDR